MESMGTCVIPLFTDSTVVEAATGDKFTYTFAHPAIVKDFQLLVVNEVVDTDTTAAKVAVDLDPSDSARVQKVEFTIADASAIGTSYVAHTVEAAWRPFNVKPGDQIIVEQTVQGVDPGTATGEYVVFMFLQFYPDRWV